MAATRLSDNQKTELVSGFRAGESTQALADRFGCSANTVIRVAKTVLGAVGYEQLKRQRGRGGSEEAQAELLVLPMMVAADPGATAEVHDPATDLAEAGPGPLSVDSAPRDDAAAPPDHGAESPLSGLESNLSGDENLYFAVDSDSDVDGAETDDDDLDIDDLIGEDLAADSVADNLGDDEHVGSGVFVEVAAISTDAVVALDVDDDAEIDDEVELDDEAELDDDGDSDYGEDDDDDLIGDEDDGVADDAFDSGLSGDDDQVNSFLPIAVMGFGIEDHGAPAALRPLASAQLPASVYMLVDKTVELQSRPLSEITELGQLAPDERDRQALVVFANPRQAKRLCGRTQRVIKLPDTRVIERTAPYLLAQGISRVVIEGALYSLPGS
ncbi:MAG: hypothetical protein NTV57_17185 [Cyanobacteria bacterium]|nr:hypothetical protein [Cyanobacteriota bacterium]